jgi:hypothetical protein
VLGTTSAEVCTAPWRYAQNTVREKTNYCSLENTEILLLLFSKAKKAESSPNAEPSDEGNSREHSAGEWTLCELQLVQEGWSLPFGLAPLPL